MNGKRRRRDPKPIRKEKAFSFQQLVRWERFDGKPDSGLPEPALRVRSRLTSAPIARWCRLLVLAKQRGARYHDAQAFAADRPERALHGPPQ